MDLDENYFWKKVFSEIQDGRQKMGPAKNYKLNESWNFYFPTKMFISGEKFLSGCESVEELS